MMSCARINLRYCTYLYRQQVVPQVNKHPKSLKGFRRKTREKKRASEGVGRGTPIHQTQANTHTNTQGRLLHTHHEARGNEAGFFFELGNP